MLISMHVKNLALIEEAEVDFNDHLNILTGETGAGKSILIGSIQSALGGRIPKEMIREGSDSALIELIFQTDNPSVLSLLGEYEIPCEDGEILIQRRVTRGRVINRINDCTVTVSRLKEIAPLLLDLSGQHENQLLLKPRNHRAILDSYGRGTIRPLLERIKLLYKEYTELSKELSGRTLKEDERLREMEFLRYEMKEIEEARLVEGEDQELEQQYYLISHSREILEDAGIVQDLTSRGQASASDQIGRAVRHMGEIAGLDPSASDLGSQLATIDDLLSDFNRELSSYIDNLEYDDETYVQVEERLNLINHLKARYGDSIPAILAYYRNNEDKLGQLEHYEEYLEEMKGRYKELEKELEASCASLSVSRRKEAEPLAREIKKALEDLNFKEVVFDIDFERMDHYSPEGYDEVCFMISTNPGQAPRPLHEIASGGELSRIMLAIKSILAGEEGIETLIFDEIDTGISGRTAQKVSEKLSVIAGRRQVIAITHLPQIAAMADSHYLIEKTSDESTTISSISLLDEEESVEELARMLGGAKITEAVMENAREMKSLASVMRHDS